ncbi:DNA polymerase [Frankia canadensis]|uniref:DNA polymerase n=1 Tax=Frankia canadensis TaxID=1836972 RepID=UPI000C799025|nr:DNA polymerase [Frankia canadensis]
MNADEYRAYRREIQRAYRERGGDTLKESERNARRARRATPEGREQRRREKRSNYAANAGTARPSASFIGIDGEGGNDAEGRHHYYLLRAGDRALETGAPLTWEDCLSFMADLAPSNIYVGYFFDYDVSMICAGLPEQKIRRLLNRPERFRTMRDGRTYATPVPVDVGIFEIDYLPGKFFKVRRSTPAGVKNRPYVEISDVGHFFQQSFVKTLNDWNIGTPEERESIAIGKDARSEFGGVTEDIRIYNGLEIALLERLMNKFRATCSAIGYLPAKWQGPGSLAATLLRYHQVAVKTELPYWDNTRLCEDANATYYGGRFETSAVGNIPGPVYNVDINSAYPYALTQVPCLVHGRWEHTGRKPTSDLYFASGSFTATGPAAFYGLPVRKPTGGVMFPATAGNGWYWSFEIEASKHQKFRIKDSWTYHRECTCDMFPWVPGLYQERLKLKKDSQGKVLKLALNSLYGKMAQRTGAAPYNNFIWSSFITAYTRTQLQKFIHSLPACQAGNCGADVWMLATDGIFCSALPTGFTSTKQLGGWDLKEYPAGIFIVQPGLYFGGATENRTDRRPPKTRGIPMNRALESEDRLRSAFELAYASGDPKAEGVPIQLQAFTGLRLGMHRRAPATIGQWRTEERRISFDWTSKRKPVTVRDDGFLRTFPEDGDPLLMSLPYDKNLATLLDRGRLLAAYDQPDFGSEIMSLENPEVV